jgi:hypothetical protein
MTVVSLPTVFVRPRTAKEYIDIFLSVQGISDEFDEAEAAVLKADKELGAYLRSMQKRIGANVQYVQLHKETHVLEVPEVQSLH